MKLFDVQNLGYKFFYAISVIVNLVSQLEWQSHLILLFV